MKTKPIIDIERALEEKKTMQKVFIRDNGYPSSVLSLLIEYFRERQKKR